MTVEKILSGLAPHLLSLLRVVTGLTFIQHGTNKVFLFPADPGSSGVSLWSLIGIAGLIETIGGALIIVGFYTRAVSFVLAGEMAVAYFMRHAPRNSWPLLNDGELAILYCFIYLYFTAAGGGAWSIDRFTRA